MPMPHPLRTGAFTVSSLRMQQRVCGRDAHGSMRAVAHSMAAAGRAVVAPPVLVAVTPAVPMLRVLLRMLCVLCVLRLLLQPAPVHVLPRPHGLLPETARVPCRRHVAQSRPKQAGCRGVCMGRQAHGCALPRCKASSCQAWRGRGWGLPTACLGVPFHARWVVVCGAWVHAMLMGRGWRLAKPTATLTPSHACSC